MSVRECRLALVGSLVVALAASACGKAPPPPPAAPMTIAAPAEAKVKAPMTLTVSGDANPDSNGRPSPVVVRVYQLKTDAAFAAADFFKLFEDDQAVLGPELISRDEFVLAPAEKRTIDVALAGETRFVGAIAAFRNIRNSEWRVLLPTPKPKKGFTVSVERTKIALSAVE